MNRNPHSVHQALRFGTTAEINDIVNRLRNGLLPLRCFDPIGWEIPRARANSYINDFIIPFKRQRVRGGQ